MKSKPYDSLHLVRKDNSIHNHTTKMHPLHLSQSYPSFLFINSPLGAKKAKSYHINGPKIQLKK